MPSEQDDVVARAAVRSGFINEDKLEEVRKIQSKAMAATGLELTISEILLNNGFITAQQSHELAEIIAGKKSPHSPATSSKAGTGTRHKNLKRSHHSPVPRHHGRATSTHPRVGASPSMSFGAKAAIAVGIIAGLAGVALIVSALWRQKKPTHLEPAPPPVVAPAADSVSALGRQSADQDPAHTRTEEDATEAGDLLERTGAASEALRAAEAYEEEHPQDPKGALARYERVASDHPGTPEAGSATVNVARLNSILNPVPKPAETDGADVVALPPDALPGEDASLPDMSEFFAKYYSAIEKGSFTDAASLAALEAGRSKGRSKAAFEEAARVATLLQGRTTAIHSFVESKKGAELQVSTATGERKGTVVSLDEFGFTIAIEIRSGKQVLGKSQMRIAFDKLTSRQEDEFSRTWKAEGVDGALARAIVDISRDEVDLAEKQLAGATGTLADHLRSRIEKVRLARAETDAKTALEMVRRWAARADMTAAQASALLDLISKFETKHSGSSAAAKEATDIAAAKSLAHRITLAAGHVEGASEFQGHRYKLYRYPMHFGPAKAFCERVGGHLATITSKEENDFVFSLAKAAGTGAWIGATDEGSEGQWRWVTDEKLAFTAWLPNRPDGGEKELGAVVIGSLGAPGASWDDRGRWAMPFLICEWEPHKKGRAAPAAGEDPYVVPPGHTKVSLYKQDFETDGGGWPGALGKDPETGSGVLELEHTPDNKYFPRQTSHMPRGGIAATLATRVRFRYRTEGQMNVVASQHWCALTPDIGTNYMVTYPASTQWAFVDMPISDYVADKPEIDLSRGFTLGVMAVYAGPLQKIGTCFVDEYEVYDVVQAK